MTWLGRGTAVPAQPGPRAGRTAEDEGLPVSATAGDPVEGRVERLARVALHATALADRLTALPPDDADPASASRPQRIDRLHVAADRVRHHLEQCLEECPEQRPEGRLEQSPEQRPEGRLEQSPEQRPEGRLEGSLDQRPEGSLEQSEPQPRQGPG